MLKKGTIDYIKNNKLFRFQSTAEEKVIINKKGEKLLLELGGAERDFPFTCEICGKELFGELALYSDGCWVGFTFFCSRECYKIYKLKE